MSFRPIAHQRWSESADLMRACVREAADARAGIELCRVRGLPQMLIELAQDNDRLRAAVEAGEPLRAAVLNRPELLHFAALAHVPAGVAHSLVEAVASAAARKHWPLAGIWSDYGDALVAFTRRSGPVSLPARAISGSAKRYLHYIRFMQAQTAAERDAAAADAQSAFADANRDRRATDWLGLDGDGNSPVKWDFRLSALHDS
jgi:hypothetical protein